MSLFRSSKRLQQRMLGRSWSFISKTGGCLPGTDLFFSGCLLPLAKAKGCSEKSSSSNPLKPFQGPMPRTKVTPACRRKCTNASC
uniref:Uncharacterized protein n=1 Tax=Oryzias latipes TaxID=8090 RepID=A0A3P9HF03_ORYLA